MTSNICRRRIAAATRGAGVFALMVPTFAVPKEAPRANEASCRQAANGLISLLDAKSAGL
jgi:hypothetical protein